MPACRGPPQLGIVGAPVVSRPRASGRSPGALPTGTRRQPKPSRHKLADRPREGPVVRRVGRGRVERRRRGRRPRFGEARCRFSNSASSLVATQVAATGAIEAVDTF